MTSYVALDRLQEWAARREDWPLLLDHLGQHSIFGEVIYGLLPIVQAEPDLARQLLAGLPDYRAVELRTWLSRTLLAPDRPDLEAFLALAASRARLRDPAFPAPDGSGLAWGGRGFCCVGCASDQRAPDGTGWVLDAEERDVGPAEVIHESEWTATAYGAGWALRVHRFASGGLATKLYEEDVSPSAARG